MPSAGVMWRRAVLRITASQISLNQMTILVILQKLCEVKILKAPRKYLLRGGLYIHDENKDISIVSFSLNIVFLFQEKRIPL